VRATPWRSEIFCASQEISRALHLRQGRRVVARDEVGPKEKLRREEALMLHAAGLWGAAPGIPEAVALGMPFQC